MDNIGRYARFEFSQTQEKILDRLLHGENCLLLGFPGSGKTHMTAKIADSLISIHKKKVAITGSTGSASQQVEQRMDNCKSVTPQTVHSFFGFQYKELAVIERNIRAFQDMITFQYKRQVKSRTNLLEYDVLVVDEVSMLTSSFVTALDITAKLYRKKGDAPFGGLTLLFVGDFRQLPPVCMDTYRYPFLCPLWDTWIKNTFCLNFIIRQEADNLFTDLIMGMSHNEITPSHRRMLRERVVPNGKVKIMDPAYMPDALRVFHTNQMVDSYNKAVTSSYENMQCYTTGLRYDFPESFTHEMRNKIRGKRIYTSEKVFIGATVILTRNMCVESGAVNGAMGTIERICSSPEEADCPLYGGQHWDKYFCIKLTSGKRICVGPCIQELMYNDDNRFKYRVEYVPILLGHAMTVHRLQGCTLDMPIFYWPFDTKDNNNSPFYVVCTRVTSLSLLHLVRVPEMLNEIIDPTIISYYEKMFLYERKKTT